MAENLDAMMRKVAALLANADDPATPPAAAETYRAKADALMFKYKIDALTVPSVAGIARPVPVWRDLYICRAGSEWRNFYYWLALAVVNRNTDLRHATEYERNEEDGHLWLVLRVVGYESDVAYAQLLITTAVAEFGKRLEPKYDPSETLAQNALRMRRGGMERNRIAAVLLGTWTTENEMKAKTRKVTGLIKEEAARIGEPHLVEEVLGRRANMKTYRTSYAEGFYSTLASRIRTHVLASQQEEHGVVLASAAHAVEEAFYERYPSRRPKEAVASSVGTLKDCGKCAKAKTGYCREHGWLRPRAGRATAWSAAGSRAGSHAARGVDLGRVGASGVAGGERAALG